MTAFAIAAKRPKPKILNKRCHAPGFLECTLRFAIGIAVIEAIGKNWVFLSETR
jgi:hypothetical protein